MDALQKQLATLTQTSKNQSESFTQQLGKMQETITTLSAENKALTAQVTQEKERKDALEVRLRESESRKGRTGLIIAVVALSVLLVLSLVLR